MSSVNYCCRVIIAYNPGAFYLQMYVWVDVKLQQRCMLRTFWSCDCSHLTIDQ